MPERVRITRLREEQRSVEPVAVKRQSEPQRHRFSAPPAKLAPQKAKLEPRPRLKTPYQPTKGDIVYLAGKRHILGTVAQAGPEQSEVKWSNGNTNVVVNYWIVKAPPDLLKERGL